MKAHSYRLAVVILIFASRASAVPSPSLEQQAERALRTARAALLNEIVSKGRQASSGEAILENSKIQRATGHSLPEVRRTAYLLYSFSSDKCAQDKTDLSNLGEYVDLSKEGGKSSKDTKIGWKRLYLEIEVSDGLLRLTETEQSKHLTDLIIQKRGRFAHVEVLDKESLSKDSFSLVEGSFDGNALEIASYTRWRSALKENETPCELESYFVDHGDQRMSARTASVDQSQSHAISQPQVGCGSTNGASWIFLLFLSAFWACCTNAPESVRSRNSATISTKRSGIKAIGQGTFRQLFKGCSVK
jgi:hypothetical protein